MICRFKFHGSSIGKRGCIFSGMRDLLFILKFAKLGSRSFVLFHHQFWCGAIGAMKREFRDPFINGKSKAAPQL
jgi:hypothetical protein